MMPYRHAKWLLRHLNRSSYNKKSMVVSKINRVAARGSQAQFKRPFVNNNIDF